MFVENKLEYSKIRTKDFIPDCKIISKIRASVDDGLENEESDSTMAIRLEYPDTIRIIHLSKEIDIHSLIGNIGGYMGLFLGNISG